MEEIDKLAQKLYKEVLDEYNAQGDTANRKALGELLDEKLTGYNEATKEIIEGKVFEAVGGATAFKSLPSEMLTGVALSDTLYKNSKNVSRESLEILNQGIKAKAPISEISKKLYDGYGFKDKEVLDVTKKLPKYLQRELKRDKVSSDLIKYVDKIKTKPLKTALNKIVKKMDGVNQIGLQKALKVALEEKSRYYASRIADTESYRARNLSRAKEYLEDEDVEFVKFTMSSRHPMMDICDYYARLDVGYGAGIVPKEQMITLPLHPHCHCKYNPHYKKVKKRHIKNPEKYTMDKFSLRDQQRIAGSFDNLRKFNIGTPIESVFNSVRPHYPIRKYSEVFDIEVHNVSKKIVKQKNNIPKIEFGYDGKFDGYVEDIRDESKIVIDKLPKPYEMKTIGVSKGSYYSDGSKMINGKSGTLVSRKIDGKKTFLHEYGHHIDSVSYENLDNMSGINTSMKNDFIEARKLDIEHLKAKFSGKSMFNELKDRWSGDKEMDGMSDIFDSLSLGRFYDEYRMPGHGSRYFNAKSGVRRKLNRSMQQTEVFAQLFEAWSQNGRAWKESLEFYPNQSLAFEKSMKGIINE